MAKKINLSPGIIDELEIVIQDIYHLSKDMGEQVEKILQEGRDNPLSQEETIKLLSTVIAVLRESAKARKDKETLEAFSGEVDVIVDRIIEVRDTIDLDDKRQSPIPSKKKLELLARNSVQRGPVNPVPWFHGRAVPMIQGYLKTIDIALWDDNDRLDIHLSQFKQIYGREPSPEELRDIMLSKVPLPGIMDLPGLSREEKEDQFAIKELARSIATNGVQRPPILDRDFTLLDGNRRVTACQYILESDEFDLDAKKRAEYIYVWKLTDNRTSDDRYNVIISLNFEPSYKKDWPEYIRIRRIYEAFQEKLIVTPNAADRAQLEMRREISDQFALKLSQVTRYIKMMRMVDEFEEYHINQKNMDEYEVKHRANRYIQYFDELTKGTTPGTVQYELDRDRGFKNLVFDLLYNGVFESFAQVRNLKYIYDDKAGHEALGKAKEATDPAMASEHFEDAMALARTAKAEKRELAANAQIERFAQWLEELPSRTYRDVITLDNLERLLKALKLVEPIVKDIIKSRKGKNANT